VGWRLDWREGDEPADVASAEELEEILRGLAHERHGVPPLGAFLAAPDGKWMGIGLAEPSVLTFQLGADPPYFMSAGSATPTNDDPLVYSFQGHLTEFPAEAGIPLERALAAATEFFVSGNRPASIEWKEV
jgi:Immunity protein Imm1